MKNCHELEDWLSWMDELAEKNYVVVDHFLGPERLNIIQSFFRSHLDNFTKAGIGALADNMVRPDIRGDYTYWLDRKRDIELEELWNLVDETMFIYNRYCYLGLSGYEFHLAHYPKGGHYDKHLDQFNNRSNRTISMVIYLNKDWQKGDGGELEIFREDGSTVLVEPLEARCVMFKSADVPHAVLASNKPRYSLTGWLLQQPSALGQFLG
ncbi:2OG-Fe(II) oxygenase [Algoriphagus sediminis]|uniref:2OG-Fe(II) oxygenase n=1 Tax=Algoriphagus sediminis TaxID=3057113 RepID=A0ABT7Y9L6_9BACT|nr:2OG-Fe(II) oxygenase [Algoriphagus sediminis]MDN3203208.1 2OG-Fe(II) oxygenase [Algoriphagus sediminis]